MYLETHREVDTKGPPLKKEQDILETEVKKY